MIELAGVTFSYSQRASADPPVLQDITLAVAPGTRVALLGHNGSGKTTLAKLMAGIVKARQGSVRVDGFDPADGKAIWEVRRRVGLVFQSPDDQLVTNTLVDDIAFGPENLGLPRQEIAQRVEEVVALLGLAPHRTTPINELSIGLKQRVAIAGILAMRPQYMIFDEPTSMLPQNLARQLLATITDLVHRYQIGVIFITHDMEEAATFDRCVVIDGGRIALDGPPQTVFGAIEQMRALGLDVPLVTDLGRRLWQHGLPLPPTILTEAELVAALSALPPSQSDASAWHTVAPPEDVPPPLATPPTTDSAKPSVLATHHLRYTHLKGTPFAQTALEDVTLAVEPGEFIACVGPTRSGKSTLADCLNAILRPGPGMVFFNGQDVATPGFDLARLRFAVGVVYQQPESQILQDVVGKDVAFGPLRQKVTLAESRQRVQASLDAVGLPYEDFRNRYTYTLSGGQKRRVAIAGVLAMHPRVLILDEPTAGLDPRGRREFLALIRQLHREQGLTIIYLSATLAEVIDLATHIVILDGGRVAFDGAPSALLAQPEIAQRLEIGLDEGSRLGLALRSLLPNLAPGAHTLSALESAIVQRYPIPAAVMDSPEARHA